MTTTRSHLSLEYLRYPVRSVVDGLETDPTIDTLQFSFPLWGEQPTSWVNGQWETTVSGAYFARMLIGPSAAFIPAPDTLYDVWVKITDSPEIPARKIDTLMSE